MKRHIYRDFGCLEGRGTALEKLLYIREMKTSRNDEIVKTNSCLYWIGRNDGSNSSSVVAPSAEKAVLKSAASVLMPQPKAEPLRQAELLPKAEPLTKTEPLPSLVPAAAARALTSSAAASLLRALTPIAPSNAKPVLPNVVPTTKGKTGKKSFAGEGTGRELSLEIIKQELGNFYYYP